MWRDHAVLVTGATGGIGQHLCESLISAGARVIAHGLHAEEVDALTARLGCEGLVCNFASLAAVRSVELPAIDVLINNAGIGFGANQLHRETSADGHELRFAVNYLAAVLLTRRYLARGTLHAIVNVASAGQRALDFDDLQTAHGYDGMTAYRRSKLAMVMWAFDLAERQPVPVVSLHPGTFLDTGMVRQSGITPLGTARHGAEMVRIAAERALTNTTGVFFDEIEPARCDDQAYDASARALLRERTDALLDSSC
ncbi:MAG TPA: SDR family NAD(P)-dependent oxidoreductase [Kofleriaceae bacterium]|jgi:NAD(P)-dependent dehydrogenase (short-subunit alcohol dehydrogenase family)